MNKEDIIKELKTVYDPEMPSIDIFNLGLVYDQHKDKDGFLYVKYDSESTFG